MDLQENKPESLPNPTPQEPKPQQVMAELNSIHEAAAGDAHCKRCHNQVSETFYFCPHCGYKIKEPPYHFSIIGTISILLISFLFPPFGLIPGFKYLRKDDKRAKLVGILAIVVTGIALFLFAYFIQLYLNMLNNTINSINPAYY